MGAADFGSVLDRAEHALDRIERALATSHPPQRDEQLRATVRDALTQLDDIIRAVESNG